MLDELSTIKYQLNGGPEHQTSIPELELEPPPSAPSPKHQPTETTPDSDLESLIDELDGEHLTRLEQRVRSAIDGTS